MGQVGWIKLHRQILDSDVWLYDEPFDVRSAWVDLLMLANHEDKTMMISLRAMTIKRGQHLTSVRKLSKRWRWSHTRVLKYLRALEQMGMIHKDATHGGTLITIVKYSFFQDFKGVSETPNGTHAVTQDGTHAVTIAVTQPFHKQEDKNDINNDLRRKEIIGAAPPSSSGGDY